MERQSNLPFFLRYTQLNQDVCSNIEGCTFNKVQAKYRYTLFDKDIMNFVTYTDEDLKRKNRNNKLRNFMEHYSPLLNSGRVSVLSLVVYPHLTQKFSDFIKYFKFKRLKQLGIDVFGHIYVCDIGLINRRSHFHLFIATSPISEKLIKRLFPKSKQHKFKGILMDKTFSLIPYCMKKDLFSKPSSFSFRSSKIFKSPIL